MERILELCGELLALRRSLAPYTQPIGVHLFDVVAKGPGPLTKRKRHPNFSTLCGPISPPMLWSYLDIRTCAFSQNIITLLATAMTALCRVRPRMSPMGCSFLPMSAEAGWLAS